MLLQHRVSWSHFGDTWALPGGARHEGESATDGALREAAEEAGVPDAAIRPRLLSVFDLGYWSYTTLVGDVVRAVRADDQRSREPRARVGAAERGDGPAAAPGLRVVVGAAAAAARHPSRRRRGCRERRGLGARRVVARPRGRRRAAASRGSRRSLGRRAGRRRSSCPSTRGSRSGSRSSRDRRARPVRTPRASRWCGPRHPVTTRSSRQAERLVAAGATVTVVTSDRELVGAGDGCRRRRARSALAARPAAPDALGGVRSVGSRAACRLSPGRGAGRCRGARAWSGVRRRGRAPARTR